MRDAIHEITKLAQAQMDAAHDSDSDFDPDDYESTDSDDDYYYDRTEQVETDLEHLDTKNIITLDGKTFQAK